MTPDTPAMDEKGLLLALDVFEIETKINSKSIKQGLSEAIAAYLAATARDGEREALAAFMLRNSFATGHGDTFEALLTELEWQVRERTSKASQEAEVVAWLHEITEPGAAEPMTMLSRSADNPWSHWMAAHRDKCTYVATPLYHLATPQPSPDADGDAA